jgi:hypothetical protein
LEDQAANDRAARTGDRHLFSSHDTAEHGTSWLIEMTIVARETGRSHSAFFQTIIGKPSGAGQEKVAPSH